MIKFLLSKSLQFGLYAQICLASTINNFQIELLEKGIVNRREFVLLTLSTRCWSSGDYKLEPMQS